MNTAIQPGLLGSLQWTPTTETHHLDTAVGDAIEAHLREAGLPVPADELFQWAHWSVPTGTELLDAATLEFHRDSRRPAPALRVEFANGLGVALLVGWSNVCGCGECGSKPTLRVVDVRPAPTEKMTTGEAIASGIVALCFVLLIPFLGLFFQ